MRKGIKVPKFINLTQYIHPHGDKELVSIEVSDEVAQIAEDQVLSCECFPNDYSKVIFYSYLKKHENIIEDNPGLEKMMIANNGPGENSPAKVLKRLINEVNKNKDCS